MVYGIHHGTTAKDEWGACRITQKVQDQIIAWENKAEAEGKSVKKKIVGEEEVQKEGQKAK